MLTCSCSPPCQRPSCMPSRWQSVVEWTYQLEASLVEEFQLAIKTFLFLLSSTCQLRQGSKTDGVLLSSTCQLRQGSRTDGRGCGLRRAAWGWMAWRARGRQAWCSCTRCAPTLLCARSPSHRASSPCARPPASSSSPSTPRQAPVPSRPHTSEPVPLPAWPCTSTAAHCISLCLARFQLSIRRECC